MTSISFSFQRALTVLLVAFFVGTASYAKASVSFFFSFDTQPDGMGASTDAVTAETFPGTPTFARTGTSLTTTGGEASFTDFQGVTWLGSGNFNGPGHNAGFQSGSLNNSMSLTFDTTGLEDLTLRMAIRSAGTGAVSGFSDLTYDIGGGPVSIGSVDLTFATGSTFAVWTADLSSVSDIENQSSVTLTWDIPNVVSGSSLRIDNIQFTAVPEPSVVGMLIGGIGLIAFRRARS